MSIRPHLRCLRCGYTWHPRGADRSRRCPGCGVVFDGEAPTEQGSCAPRAIGIVGGVGLVGCLGIGAVVVVCAGVVALVGGPKQVAKEKAEPVPAAARPAGDRAQAGPQPPAVTPGPTAPKSEPTPARTALAPAPRRVQNRRPDGFISEWIRRGDIETRVTGAVIARPILADPKGTEFAGPESVLLVWVETRSAAPSRVEVRRWVGALESAARLVGATGILAPVRFPGSVLVGQIDRGVRLSVGGPAAEDVMAFAVPGAAAQTLSLRLAGSHVGEGGDFDHDIPPAAWKK